MCIRLSYLEGVDWVWFAHEHVNGYHSMSTLTGTTQPTAENENVPLSTDPAVVKDAEAAKCPDLVPTDNVSH